ncbi:MAG: hypothetical protein KGL53_13725, partial [Elusimicrobia bacterium]|nr:hypothetical protein [Elusimicrobiota bacterium]
PAEAAAALAPLQSGRALPPGPRPELSLAREIVLKHDGGIALRAGEDGGSVLSVSLGVAARPAGPAA